MVRGGLSLSGGGGGGGDGGWGAVVLCYHIHASCVLAMLLLVAFLLELGAIVVCSPLVGVALWRRLCHHELPMEDREVKEKQDETNRY